MNIECIFVAKKKEDRHNLTLYYKLGQLLQRLEEQIEIYPVTMAYTIRTTRVYHVEWYTRYITTLHPDDLLLFVAGKLHHMDKNDLRQYVSKEERHLLSYFHIVNPDLDEDPNFCKDIKEYY